MIQTEVKFTSDGESCAIELPFLINSHLIHSAYHEGDMLPAKVVPKRQECYVSYDGYEIEKSHFEYLIGTGFNWTLASHGHVPAGAVSSGKTANGEPLYVGRARYEGNFTPGKIHPSHGCLYIPYGGYEHSIKYYEVLVKL
jgi:hypothetical protein